MTPSLIPHPHPSLGGPRRHPPGPSNSGTFSKNGAVGQRPLAWWRNQEERGTLRWLETKMRPKLGLQACRPQTPRCLKFWQSPSPEWVAVGVRRVGRYLQLLGQARNSLTNKKGIYSFPSPPNPLLFPAKQPPARHSQLHSVPPPPQVKGRREMTQ